MPIGFYDLLEVIKDINQIRSGWGTEIPTVREGTSFKGADQDHHRISVCGSNQLQQKEP